MDQLLVLAADPSAWLALATLAVMEVVLGVDNLVFIALLSSRLPPKEGAKARRIGIGLSLLLRLVLVTGAAYAVRLTAPLFTIFTQSFSFRDLILIWGGLFLVFKATTEIHHTIDPVETAARPHRATFPVTAGQIVLLDLVFSIDSIITAVGMTEHIPIMIGAVIIAVMLILVASGPLANFIRRNPTIVMLALGFLLLIGATLIADGFGFHFPRGYIYAAMAFSAMVESLNMLARKRRGMQLLHENSGAPPDRVKSEDKETPRGHRHEKDVSGPRNEMAALGDSDRTDSTALAEVLLPLAIDHPYSYLIPHGTSIAPGAFVEVPLGTKLTDGVVWQVSARASGNTNLKPIVNRRDLSPLSTNLRKFIDWVARWTLSPRGMVLRMAIGAPLHARPELLRVGVRFNGPAPRRMTPARARVLAAAEGGIAFSKAALAEAAACSAGVIDSLVDEGTLETIALPPELVALPCDPAYATPVLEAAQQSAALELAARARARKFSATLLEGVTGSGKTEVYFEAVAAALAMGRQSLILMPEIVLTAQFLERFAARFGARPGEWHSGVSAGKRARLWGAVAKGEAKAVIGARSALFLPFNDLAAIIVDEEHEPAYKQEDGVAYHARDMAVVRGQIENCPVVLVSATPSLESRVNAAHGRYGHSRLASRFNAKALPALTAIDLRTDAAPRGKWIAPKLASEISKTLANGEQALLFLNRRGYAPLTLCRACGHRFNCPNCTAWLVEHRFRRALMCHHCGHVERKPAVCPSCEAVDSLTACGPGIERLAEEAAELFPGAKILTLSSDFPGGTERLRAEIDAISRGDCDIVIGTQLVAKGHNFPYLSLAGIIDADIGLTTGDPRAAERTFQLLQQVTGRAGRFETAGRAFIQTWQPEHPVMRALLSGDSERFYEEEIHQRRRAGLPPFGRLAAVIVSAKDGALAQAHARALVQAAYALPPSDSWSLPPPGSPPNADELTLLGPAEAPIAVIRGRYRFRLLVRAPRSADLQAFLRAWLAAGPKEKGSLRVAVDVDPQSFL